MSAMGDKVKEALLNILRGIVDEPCRIEDGLYLGSASTAHKKETLQAVNVTHILTVASALDPSHPSDFEYKRIDAVDSPSEDLRRHFDECFEFIDRARQGGGAVLVHCFAGVSRSATVVIAYMMKKHGLSRVEATALVRSKRPQVNPNFGFVKQLDMFEKSLGESV